MIVYADASAILRHVLEQPGAIQGWDRIERLIASRLAQAECLRTLDRHRFSGTVPDSQLILARETLTLAFGRFEFVEITPVILSRAGEPIAVPLGTLDAIHLVTATAWQEITGLRLTMATHDTALADAARLYGMPVLG